MRTIHTPIPAFKRPSKDVINALKDIGTATVAGSLGHAGFRNPHMQGPVTQNPGKSIVGVAQTLQFLPQRPDLFSEGEYSDPETQLHRHVLYEIEEDPKRSLLTRRMTTFRKVGDLYRRGEAVHTQRLYKGADIASCLRREGFRVRLLRGYGTFRFPDAHAGFLARKT